MMTWSGWVMLIELVRSSVTFKGHYSTDSIPESGSFLVKASWAILAALVPHISFKFLFFITMYFSYVHI